MTNAIDATTSNASTTSPSALKPPGATMDKETFLKLLVAQISTQDPLNPMQGTEFVSQLSQFAVVEQAIAQSTKLDTLSTQMSGLSNNEATSLVGKSVTVRGRGLAFDGTLATSTQVSLGAPATKVVATVRDSQGKAIRTLDLGAKPAGPLAVAWDGRDDVGNSALAGNYTVDVKASSATGEAVAVTQDVTGVVTRVSYNKGYPELLLDNGTAVSIADLVSVGAPPAAR